MKAKDWPKLKEVTKNGRKMIMVDARIGGRGERKFFFTKRAAETWAQLQSEKRENEGAKVFDDRELAKFGLTVADAVKFTLAHYRQQAESKPVKEAVKALVDFKRGSVGSTLVSDIKNRLERFAEAFVGSHWRTSRR